MQQFLYFFRGVPDDTVYESYSQTHIALLLLTAAISLYIYFNRDKLQKPSISKKLKYFFVVALLTQQAILYIWYIASGYFSITESLPLYHCRVAVLCTAFGLITDRSLPRTLGCLWGSIGAIVALLLPNPDPFLFPHYTLLSYFAGHMVLLWANMYVLFVQDFVLEKENLVKTLVFTNLFHLFVLIFDMVTGANYCYLLGAPFEIPILETPFLKMIYTPAIFILFSLAIIVFYIFTNARQLAEDHCSGDSWSLKKH